MADNRRTSVYVDYHILDLIARPRVSDEALLPEWNAGRSIWDRYTREAVSLVTSVDEMELDFVVQMKSRRPVRHRYLRITDNIDDLSSAGKGRTTQTRNTAAIVHLYDQLDVISGMMTLSESMPIHTIANSRRCPLKEEPAGTWGHRPVR